VKRILGIDPGTRRIGLALSDPTGTIAEPLETIDTRRTPRWMDRLREIVERYDVGEIVVGLPVTLAGREGESARMARELAARVERELDRPVRLWDERLSTAEARRVLRGERAEKGAADRVAAALVLQSYLEAHGGAGEAD
jgi:putative Holliday junction resolvase